MQTTAKAALPAYDRRFSWHDCIQPLRFALLVLRQFLRTDCRGHRNDGR
jgi:hypothetical protein